MAHATAPSVQCTLYIWSDLYIFAKRPYTSSLSNFTGNELVITFKNPNFTKKNAEKKSANSNFVVMTGQENLENFRNSQFSGKSRSWESSKFPKTPNFLDSQIHVK